MSAGEIAGLIAAIAFVLLVGVLAVPLLKLGRTVDATTEAINRITDRTDPILSELRITVASLNQTVDGVNGQLDKVDVMTTQAEHVTTNVSNLVTLFTSTLGAPLVKVAAFAYGVRSAVKERKQKGKHHGGAN